MRLCPSNFAGALLLGLLCLPLAVQAQHPTAELQQILDTFLAENPSAPGVVVHAICPPLDLDWTGTTGFMKHDSDTPLTATHTFRTASNTKTYVAAAVLRLMEKGQLTLDDTLAQHLKPDWAALLRTDGYDLEAMTLRQVLSHTSGLWEHPADPRYAEAIFADPHRVWTTDEVVRATVEWGDPVGPPGAQWSYSDTGYIILGSIIEQITGRSLGVAVHELLDYERLGLNATWWEIMETAPDGAGPRAHQYLEDQDSYDWHPSMDLYGGGGLVTDARDLALFTRKLMKGGVFAREETLGLMLGSGTADYRLGLAVADLCAGLGYGHTGFWNTFVYHLPSLDLTVSGCVLNHSATHGQALAKQLAEALVD